MLSYANHRLQVLAESLEAMSTAVTSHGLNSITETGETSWPYVTLPSDQFEANAEHDTSFSRNHFVWTSPIVHDVNAWNVYNEAIYSNDEVPVNRHMFMNGVDGKVPVNGTGPFVPVHQFYSEITMPNILNNNSMNNFDTSSDPSFVTFTTWVSNLQSAALTGILPLPFLRDVYPEIFDASEQLSIYIEPIFDSFQETPEIVGYIQSLFEWNFFFSKFSSEGINLVCVVKNTCGDQFAYVINSDLATYISNDVVHNIIFADVSATSVIGLDEDDVSIDDIETTKETGFCIYSLTVYPTNDFRQSFKSNAVLYTVVVGIVMFIMVASFFAYDS